MQGVTNMVYNLNLPSAVKKDCRYTLVINYPDELVETLSEPIESE